MNFYKRIFGGVLKRQFIASESYDADHSQLQGLASRLDSGKEIVKFLCPTIGIKKPGAAYAALCSLTVVCVHLNIISSMMRSAPTACMRVVVNYARI